MAVSNIFKPFHLKTQDVKQEHIQVNSGGYQYSSTNFTPPSGYKPMAIAGYRMDGSGVLIPIRMILSGNSVQWAFINRDSGTSDVTLTVRVLCAKG